MRQLFLGIVLLVAALTACAQSPIWRVNPVTTNTPAGVTNLIVAIAGTAGQTNNVVLAAGPNTTITTNTSAGVTTYTVSALGSSNSFSANLTNYVTITNGLTFTGPNGGIGYYFEWVSDHLVLTNIVFLDALAFNNGLIVYQGANQVQMGNDGHVSFTGTASGNGGGISNINLKISGTNSSAPATPGTVKAWVNVTLPDGNILKMPLYQ